MTTILIVDDEARILAALRRSLRREGWKTYVETPMPSRKSEEWRYTDLGDLDPESFAPVTCEGERVKSIDDLPAPVRAALASDRERAGVLARHNGCLEHLRLDETLQAKGVIYAPLLDVAEERPELLERFLFKSDVAPMEQKLWAPMWQNWCTMVKPPRMAQSWIWTCPPREAAFAMIT